MENQFIQRAYNLPKDSPAETRALYDDWAHQYDQDCTRDEAYLGPQVLADTLAKWADTKSEILDVGCGTGLGGVALLALGATRIDGVDFSTGMLEKARATKVYRRLFTDFYDQVSVPSCSYDTVFSVGALGLGHIGPEAFAEFARIARPGGIIVVNVDSDSWVPGGYDVELDRLTNQGTFKLLFMEEVLEHRRLGTRTKNLVLQTPSTTK